MFPSPQKPGEHLPSNTYGKWTKQGKDALHFVSGCANYMGRYFFRAYVSNAAGNGESVDASIDVLSGWCSQTKGQQHRAYNVSAAK